MPHPRGGIKESSYQKSVLRVRSGSGPDLATAREGHPLLLLLPSPTKKQTRCMITVFFKKLEQTARNIFSLVLALRVQQVPRLAQALQGPVSVLKG